MSVRVGERDARAGEMIRLRGGIGEGNRVKIVHTNRGRKLNVNKRERCNYGWL